MKLFVYGISHPEGFTKIGVASDPWKRLTDLQIGSPFELSLEWKVEVEGEDVAYSLESFLHRLFSSYWHRGEWFSISPELVYNEVFLLRGVFENVKKMEYLPIKPSSKKRSEDVAEVIDRNRENRNPLVTCSRTMYGKLKCSRCEKEMASSSWVDHPCRYLLGEKGI